MTKILYNRAAKTFMDAISAGFDENGAYEKVKKKHGKVLADAVYAEALAEMKAEMNPREYLKVSKPDPTHIIKINPAQLKILITAHKQKHGEFHPQSETQARNIARLKEKGLFDFIVDKELHLSVYRLSTKGHKLISKYLSHRGAK